jgi:GNAT superfamily N-acetyltransferase
MKASSLSKNKETTVTTEVLVEKSLADDELLALVQLINEVYDDAEASMWSVQGYRTSLKEVNCLIQEKKLIVAKIGGATGKVIVVGCIKVGRIINVDADKQITTTTMGGLGMMVVDPVHRGNRIGCHLIQAAEDWAFQQGYTTMQLEMLTPRHWKQPSKEFNKAWYLRLGYAPQNTVPFEQDYAHVVHLLATECDFTIWHKNLR